MRHFILFFCLLLTTFCFGQEEIKYKEYSFSEFFELIDEEKKDVFRLKNALIILDTLKDQNFLTIPGNNAGHRRSLRTDTIHVRKAIRLENVIFDPFYGKNFDNPGILHKVVFHETVGFENVFGEFQDLHFRNSLSIWFNDNTVAILRALYSNTTYERFRITKSTFEIDPQIVTLGGIAKEANPFFEITECEFKSNSVSNNAFILLREFGRVIIRRNTFDGIDPVLFRIMGNSEVYIEDNDFGNRWTNVDFPEQNNVVLYTGNKHDFLVGLSLSESTSNITIDWSQFKHGLIDSNQFTKVIFDDNDNLNGEEAEELFNRNRKFINGYKDSTRIENREVYKAEIKLLGTLTGIYRRQHDTESANASYIALKDLETERLEYLYEQNPSFDTFFEWKVNQFLKVFSDYGTRPAKAITMSVYVVFIFAFIYLFFPNYWDSHGKNRIVDRYSFFLKYMKKDAGMQDVYLEEKQQELMAYDDYKSLIESSGKDVPKFFQATALPMYKWAISGTKLSAAILSKVDVMKGTWSELPQSKRVWKSFLLVSAFLIALLYDIFIKILNALMLSINTFTTLGFGEIPIKGLPRYLAIIQGFIGWFMLTIFSVSLISQLLN